MDGKGGRFRFLQLEGKTGVPELNGGNLNSKALIRIQKTALKLDSMVSYILK